MAEGKIMDLTIVCRSFPEMQDPQIIRDNILDTIETVFNGDTALLVVEGVEGIGKTSLLAHFAKRHPNHAISIFLTPTSRWAYDPSTVTFDLLNQMKWILEGTEIPDDAPCDVTSLRLFIRRLFGHARRKREIILTCYPKCVQPFCETSACQTV